MQFYFSSFSLNDLTLKAYIWLFERVVNSSSQVVLKQTFTSSYDFLDNGFYVVSSFDDVSSDSHNT